MIHTTGVFESLWTVLPPTAMSQLLTLQGYLATFMIWLQVNVLWGSCDSVPLPNILLLIQKNLPVMNSFYPAQVFSLISGIKSYASSASRLYPSQWQTFSLDFKVLFLK